MSYDMAIVRPGNPELAEFEVALGSNCLPNFKPAAVLPLQFDAEYTISENQKLSEWNVEAMVVGMEGNEAVLLTIPELEFIWYWEDTGDIQHTSVYLKNSKIKTVGDLFHHLVNILEE